MSKKVVAHSYSVEAVMALFCKYPPHTEKGKEYFQPSTTTINTTDYQRIDILPDYQQLRDKRDRDLPYVLHVPTGVVYSLPRYGKLLECQELQQIAVEMGELDPADITEVPEGCTYWMNWENDTVEVDHPYKEVIRDLLEIVKSCGYTPEDISKYHVYTQKVLSGEYTV
jgi:hypothetical protein